MWIMTPFGIIMPSAIPDNVGELVFDLQVRAREKAALRKFIKRYMYDDPHTPIEYMPHTDYEFRFHCRKSDFAAATAAMMETIDYVKFKPTTSRPGNGGDDLHNLYNTLWYVIAQHYDSTIVGGEGPHGPKRRVVKRSAKRGSKR